MLKKILYLILFILGFIAYFFLSTKFIFIIFFEFLILFIFIIFIIYSDKMMKFFKKMVKINPNKGGFTLIELVIVITIISILTAVSYISISKFLKENNDRIRKADLNQILLALQNINGSLPLPDNYTSLYFSGKLIGFQGSFCTGDFVKLDLHAKIKDPETGKCYSYLLNSNRDKYQLYTDLNTSDNAYILGDKLGIITTGNNVIDSSYTGKIDLYDNDNTYKIYTDENNFINSNTIKPFIKNCSDLKKYGLAKNSGIYSVYSGTTEKKVYCYMDIKGGGWTTVVNVVDPSKINWDGTGIDSLGNSYNSGNNWIFSRIGVNELFTGNLNKHQALIKYSDGNYVILDYYSGDIQAFYNGKYGVQISNDNCVADNGRCSSTSSSNVSWGYFCNDKDPFFENYTFGTGWAGSSPNKSSYDCNNKIGTIVGIK